jgi:glutamate racemase
MTGVDIDMTAFVAGVGAHLTVEQRLAVDTVILGCTHFPHLVEDLKGVFPSARHWVDPALQVARQVASFVRGKLRGAGPPMKVAAFTSSQGAVRYQSVFMGLGFGVPACERRVTTEQEALI